ncbi:putative T7SS-secreted protein [Streptomyces boninensis]|uniref:putative T7SS-secreted protein n=1 Tax=Streptomyces boninensis TaxID=2039455 RepID=UPI003B2163C9
MKERREPTIDEYPALGFVPCPGSQNVANSVSSTARHTADALAEICRVLDGTGLADWKGKAAEAFRAKFHDDFRPKMHEARDSFKKAAKALEDWADYMERKQHRADKLEEDAHVINERLGKAYEKKEKLGKAPEKEKESAKHEEAATNVSRKINADEIELENMRRAGRRLRTRYQEARKEIANRLDSAMNIAPDEPSPWDKLGDFFSDAGDFLADLPGEVASAVKDAASAIGTWMKEHADWITVAASVVGVIAIFCPVLAPLAIGLSAVALFSHAAAYGVDGLFGKNASIGNWLTLGGDMLGMVPGVGAAKAGAMAGFKAARGAGGVAAGTKVGIKTAGTTAKNVMKAADPVAKVIDKPVMAVATKLGASRGAALTATEVTQAAAQTAWTAPTAINAYNTTPGRVDAANWGTGVGNIATGAGGGKFGGITAVGSAIGLGAWELTD